MNPLLFLFSLTCVLSGPINGELVGDPGLHASIIPDPSNPFLTMSVEENDTGNDTRGSTWLEAVGGTVGSIWDYLSSGELLSDIGGAVKSAFFGLIDIALGMTSWFFHQIQSGVEKIFSGITSFVSEEEATKYTGIGATVAVMSSLALIMMVFIGIRISVWIMDMLDSALPDEIMDMIPFV